MESPLDITLPSLWELLFNQLRNVYPFSEELGTLPPVH